MQERLPLPICSCQGCRRMAASASRWASPGLSSVQTFPGRRPADSGEKIPAESRVGTVRWCLMENLGKGTEECEPTRLLNEHLILRDGPPLPASAIAAIATAEQELQPDGDTLHQSGNLFDR